MEARLLRDFDWKLFHVAASDTASGISAPLLRLQLFVAGAPARRHALKPSALKA